MSLSGGIQVIVYSGIQDESKFYTHVSGGWQNKTYAGKCSALAKKKFDKAVDDILHTNGYWKDGK